MADTEEKPQHDITLAIEDACSVALRQLELCQVMRTLNKNATGPIPVLAVLVKVGEGATEFIDHLNAIRGSL